MQKLKNPLVLTVAAMLIALATVFGFFKVPINQFVEFRFGFLPISAAGMLFGPAVGALVGALSDIVGYFAKPTGPFFPGFTISSAVAGVLYGLCLYKKPVTIPRVVLAQFLYTIVISFGLNTLNLCILYHSPFIPTLITRIPQSSVMFVINTVLLYTVLSAIQQISKHLLPAEFNS